MLTCTECILTILALMLGAAILGYLIARALMGNKSPSQQSPSESSPVASPTESKEYQLLLTRYKDLEVNYQSAQTEIQNLKTNAGAAPIVVNAADERKKKRAALLATIATHQGELDWNRIGGGGPDDKDNLKRLPGLGAFVEQKLNALGIYKFSQLAHLTAEDEARLNQILELPKNKFQKAGWVQEAKLLSGMITEEEVILERVSGKKSWFNYDRLGRFAAEEKDPLQEINGVGPFIEEKLNALDIYKFVQLSKLTKREVALLNDAIELNAGHIERDDWVSQAKNLMKG
ncbi:MAG: hypothetical protein AAFR61_05535 [Bacteroidota bacterium]